MLVVEGPRWEREREGAAAARFLLGGPVMSTAEKPIRVATPPLVEGERLDQPEFHRRYEAHPDKRLCQP